MNTARKHAAYEHEAATTDERGAISGVYPKVSTEWVELGELLEVMRLRASTPGSDDELLRLYEEAAPHHYNSAAALIERHHRLLAEGELLYARGRVEEHWELLEDCADFAERVHRHMSREYALFQDALLTDIGVGD